MNLAQFDKILKNCRCFHGILGKFLCAKFSVKKFDCAKEFAFRVRYPISVHYYRSPPKHVRY